MIHDENPVWNIFFELISYVVPCELLTLLLAKGVVWCAEGVVYLTSLGRPTDIGLQLGKACYPCSR